MKVFHLTISYDGRNYRGWQRQAPIQEEEQSSVCSTLEKAIAKTIQNKDFTVLGSGRTDSGVHARAQSVQLNCKTDMDTSTLFKAINHFLPREIRIQSVVEKNEDFHVQRNVHSKCYRYFILNSHNNEETTTWPFLFPWTWYIGQKLDYAAMEKALSFLEGTQDFSCFQNAGTELSSTVRTILEAKLLRHFEEENSINSLPWMPPKASGLELLEVRILGTGFLKQMVRNILGTLVEIGKGKYPPEEIKKLIKKKDRRFAGPTAPAQGLFLDHVVYKEDK